MAISRNARRAIAKQRKAAKQERNEKRAIAQRQQEVAEIVKDNLSRPKPSNLGNIRSCLTGIDSMSHRGYVCRAAGGMGRQRAMALKAQGKW